MKLSFIIATKDRPEEIRTVLSEFSKQAHVPYQVVVVDASNEPSSTLPIEFPHLNIKFHRYYRPPSAAAQRNFGLRIASSDADLIGFLDDDITFAPNALRNMLRFWESAPMDVTGATFNILNPEPTSANRLKRSRLIECTGLYSPRMGSVTPSGWQTVIHTVSKNIYTEWLPTTASIWRRSLIDSDFFDPFFEGYSYLEDLDASYGMYIKGHRLVVVAGSGFYHWSSSSGRSSALQFGRMETRNRLYFVRKYQLSMNRCIGAITIRAIMSLAEGNLGRLRGNLLGIGDYLKSRNSLGHRCSVF